MGWENGGKSCVWLCAGVGEMFGERGEWRIAVEGTSIDGGKERCEQVENGDKFADNISAG